jgi:hypothetical protein
MNYIMCFKFQERRYAAKFPTSKNILEEEGKTIKTG